MILLLTMRVCPYIGKTHKLIVVEADNEDAEGNC